MKVGRYSLSLLSAIFTLLTWAANISEAQDAGIVLSSGSLSSNQFQFTLIGQPGIIYFIDASTNLSDWVAVATNFDENATRLITISNAPEGQSFYRASKAPLFPSSFALLALQQITFSGGVSIDSYDSRVGGYNVTTNRNASANVATDSMATNAVTVGGSKVFGHVFTGPGGGVLLSGSGAIGDVGWNTTNIGVEPGWTNNTINIRPPSNAPPPGPFLIPTVSTSGGSNVTILASGVYQTAALSSISSTKPWFVTGNAVLYVTGSIMVSGSGYIRIFPGASLILYGGGNTTISGGGVVNSTGLAANFSYLGLNSNGSFVYSGSSTFIGTVNAPQADFTMTGASGFFGAVIAKSMNFSGGSVHYDESLGH